MNRIIRFGFATYESLVQKLSSADSPASILQIFQQNKDIFKQEHVVLSLRMLGRYSRQLGRDNSYSELTSKLNDIVDQLTEYDVIDVLFWLRKFRQNKIQTYFSQQAQIKLFQRIKEMSENQMFSFRNMCNVYYDLSILNHSNDQLAKSISEQLLTAKQLSPFLINQLFSSIVIKVNFCSISKNDTAILNNAVKALDGLLEELDIEQKSQLFKSLAEIQFQNLSPKYQLPSILKVIKDQLLQKIELLQEDSVLNIFKAYSHLPKYFEQDLIKELKEMIVTTIEQNPNNLSSKFLIILIDRISTYQNQKSIHDLIKIIIAELTQRIIKKEVELTLITQLCNNLLGYKKFEELSTALKESGETNLKILNYLYVNGVNMKEYVDSFVSNTETKRVNTFNAIHYLIYAHRDAQEHVEKFMTLCKQSIQTNPHSILRTTLEIQINASIKNQIQEEAFMQIIEELKNKKYDIFKVLKELLSSCRSNKCKSALLQYNDQSENKLQPKLILSKVIGDDEEFDQERLSIILQLLQKDPSSIPIFRLVDYLTFSNKNLYGLIRSDLIQWVCQVLIQAQQSQSVIKLNPIVNFIKRLDGAGYTSKSLLILAKKVAEHFKAANPNTPYPDTNFVEILINFNLLTPEDAVIQLNSERSYQFFKAQLCGIALQSENPPESVIQLRDKIKAECSLDAEDIKYKQILEVSTLCKLTQNEIEKIGNQIKRYASKLTTRQYFDLVINSKEYQILKDLSNIFSQFGSKLGLIKILKIIEKFQKHHLQNQMIYNVLLEQYGLQFNSTFNELRIQVLLNLASAKLKQVDVFQKTFEKIYKFPQVYKNHFNDILESLIQLGMNESQIVEQIKSMTDKQNLSNFTSLKLVHYYIMANQPIEEIEKVAQSLENFKTKENNRIALVYEILKRMYPESKVTKIHEALIKDEKILNTSRKSQFTIEYVQKILQAVGIQVEVNQSVDDVQIELYLPQTQQSILILTGYNLNYDKSLNGQGIFQKKLLELITKNVVVINFKELQDINDEAKIAYLENKGIQITVDKTQIDLSVLRQLEKKENPKKQGHKKTSHEEENLEKLEVSQ